MDEADIRERLAQLNLEVGEYIVHSSASLVLRGVLDHAGDIDIVARGSAWRQALELVTAGAAVLDRGVHDQRVSLGTDVEMYDGWLGESADEVVPRAELVAGVPCAPLADVIAMKERLGRPKDREHLARIRSYLGGAAEPGTGG
ncbi:MAG: hypothetical protein WDA03_10400 [Trueperaceae bacterium]